MIVLKHSLKRLMVYWIMKFDLEFVRWIFYQESPQEVSLTFTIFYSDKPLKVGTKNTLGPESWVSRERGRLYSGTDRNWRIKLFMTGIRINFPLRNFIILRCLSISKACVIRLWRENIYVKFLQHFVVCGFR